MQPGIHKHRDIESREDLIAVIDLFYERTFADPVLGPIFVDITKLDLDHHIPIVADFWENILFAAHKYPGGLMRVHFDVHRMTSLQPHQFQRWLDYWESSIEDQFEGPRANMAKEHAYRVARMMSDRLGARRGGPVAHVWDPTQT
jgi:hemoglobin